MSNFTTELGYNDRESKAKYVWHKYQPILQGRKILDVGADECHLKSHLDQDAQYWGIGLGRNLDQEVDLESGELPFADESFDTVLCLDVLEHLENIHKVFDELCRIARNHVIISLPNPWMSFYKTLKNGHRLSYDPMRFYGLPLEPPEDRHRWFFSNEEAERFILYRAERNGLSVLHLHSGGKGGKGEGRTVRGWVRTLARLVLFRNPVHPRNLYAGTLWAVLERPRDKKDE